jgi:lysozyme
VIVLLAIGLALLLLLGGWVWFVRLPRTRGDLIDGERFGIDVSTHQHDIDWTRVRRDGVEFAYIKATEGGDFVDDRFAANWVNAKAAGVDRGAYHFFTLCRPGKDQADNFLRVAPPDPEALPPVVDLEFVGNCSGRPERDAFLHELTTFVDQVEAATGKQMVFYLLDDFDEQYGVRRALQRRSWTRRLFQRPDTEDWLIWQSSDVGTIDGIDGAVDLDVIKAGA